jgi:hypothetical protein
MAVLGTYPISATKYSISKLRKTMETFVLKNDQGRDLRFVGERLAQVHTSPDQASSDYSGTVGRYSTWSLYRTEKLLEKEYGTL